MLVSEKRWYRLLAAPSRLDRATGQAVPPSLAAQRARGETFLSALQHKEVMRRTNREHR